MSELRTRAEVAAELHVSERTLRRLLLKVRGLAPVRAGRTMLFDAAQVTFIRAALTAPSASPKFRPACPAGFVYQVPAVGLNPYWAKLHDRARRGAVVRKLAFEIGVEELRALIARANGRCEVSGLLFNEGRQPLSQWRPFAPSLDRIDSVLPYTMPNCRLVCCAVNIALGNWGEDVLWTIALAMVARGRSNA